MTPYLRHAINQLEREVVQGGRRRTTPDPHHWELRRSSACDGNDCRRCRETAATCDCQHHFEPGYQTVKEGDDNG